MISVSSVDLGAGVEDLVLDVLRSGQLAQGPMVERLEKQFCELVGTEHAVAVSNGTVALIAALQALEIGPGDEVITSPFTFVATLNAILSVGASPVFADIDEYFLIDPSGLSAVLTGRTRAILPVHLYGLPAAMAEISAWAAAHDLAVVEDAAQAHGASVGGRRAGSFGVGCFSLYATKNVTTGEGGVLTTDSDAIATRLRLLRSQGMQTRYKYEIQGFNYRLTDLQAAVGIPQLDRLAETTARRQRNAMVLTDGLEGIEGLHLPSSPAGRTHVFHQYTVRVDDSARLSRDALADALLQDGIGTGIYYPRAVYDYDCFRAAVPVFPGSHPIAERAAKQVLSLPVHPSLSDGDLQSIVGSVGRALHD